MYCVSLGTYRNRVLQTRDNHMLDRVHTAVGHTDDLVEDHKRGLQAGQINQHPHRFRIGIARLLDLLPTARETGERKLVRCRRAAPALLAVGLLHRAVAPGGLDGERGEQNTTDVLLPRTHLKCGTLHVLTHRVANIARSIPNRNHTERSMLQNDTHLLLRILDLGCDGTEPLRKRISFTLQQRMPILCTLQTKLGIAQRLARCKNRFALPRRRHRPTTRPCTPRLVARRFSAEKRLRLRTAAFVDWTRMGNGAR